VGTLLAALKELLPLWALLLVLGFGYLILLFKKSSDRFLEIATKQADYLTARVDVVDKSTGIFTRTIEQQEKEIRRLNEQVSRLNTDLQTTREVEARLSVQELTVLSESIKEISQSQNQLLSLLPVTREIQNTIDARGEFAATIGEDISRAIRARDSSVYPIRISPLSTADDLIDRLQSSGYIASIYTESHDSEIEPSAHRAIWLGAMVPPTNAVEIIQIAHSVWPFLRYVHLSTDSGGPDETDYEVYLGGATKSAVGFLHCGPWTAADFAALSTTMSLAELHAAVRARYLQSEAQSK
jgi:hypothetical protein